MNVLKGGIFLVIFCLPLYLIRLEIFKIPTTVLELMIYILFVVWLANRGYKNLYKTIKSEKILLLGIVLLLIGAIVATFFSWNLRLSAGILKAWFFDAILFFLIFVSIIKKDDFKSIFDVLIFSGLIIAVISLIYLIQENYSYQGRMQGIYDSPNYLAMSLAIPLLLSFYLLIYEPRAFRRLLYFASCAIFLVVLAFTRSFGALLGILAALIFGLIIYFYSKGRKKEILAIIIFAFILVLAAGLIKIKSSEQGLKSFDARFVIWRTAWESFRAYPIIGIGPGTFQDYFPPFPKWGVPQPHNIFLAFLIQTGIIGFTGFILILAWFFLSAGRKTAGWPLLLMVIMAYILGHGLVDTTYWKNDLSLIFWLIIGLMAVSHYSSIE